MAEINVSRWLLGGVVAGIVIWLLEGVGGLLYMDQAQTSLERLGLSLDMTASQWVLAPVAVESGAFTSEIVGENRGFPPGTRERCTRSTGWPAPSAGVTPVENWASTLWATARFRRSGADAGGTAARSAGERSARTRGPRTAAFAARVGNSTRSRACASRVWSMSATGAGA